MFGYGFRIAEHNLLVSPRVDYEAGNGVYLCADLREWNAVQALVHPVLDGETVREATVAEVAEWFPPPVFEVSKLALRAFARANGWEETLDALIDSQDHGRTDWADAQALSSNHPTVSAAVKAYAASTGITEDAAWAMLRQVDNE